jgi:hypothetical protein
MSTSSDILPFEPSQCNYKKVQSIEQFHANYDLAMSDEYNIIPLSGNSGVTRGSDLLHYKMPNDSHDDDNDDCKCGCKYMSSNGDCKCGRKHMANHDNCSNGKKMDMITNVYLGSISVIALFILYRNLKL